MLGKETKKNIKRSRGKTRHITFKEIRVNSKKITHFSIEMVKSEGSEMTFFKCENNTKLLTQNFMLLGSIL